MSRIKSLINTLLVSYGSKNPLRNLYYKLCHKLIENKLVKKGILSYKDIVCFNDSSLQYVGHEEQAAIIALADNTLDNRFNYLGSGYCKLEPINWSKDFKSGFEWTVGTFYKNYWQVNLNDDSDVKVPRELSRSHFLLHLALAYKFTKDDKYAQKAYELISDWIKHNPLMYSINWCCSMDVGIRAMNWIWALSLFDEYSAHRQHKELIEGSLYQHGWFIYHNLEGNLFEYNNNHYFSDIVSLLHIGLLFRKDRQGAKWLDYSIKEFYRELRLQILPCGMLYEGSTHYSRLVLELVIPSISLLQRNGFAIPADIMGRYESMFGFAKNIIMPDGSFPIIADQDNGRGLPLGTENINDMRYLLSLGAVLFHRGDFKALGNGYNVYCAIFGGTDSFCRYTDLREKPEPSKSIFLRDAGLAIMKKDDDYLIFNADNQGMYKDSGTTISHTHCDWFSFALVAKGVPFIIDPGTYVYSSDTEKRNLFRSTAMHNTITIDGKDQEDINPKTLWNLKRKGNVIVEDWMSTSQNDYIRCKHSGYGRLEQPAYHTRSIDLSKTNGIWSITDIIESNGEHLIESHFHLDEGVAIEKINDGFTMTKNGISVLMMFDVEGTHNVEIRKSFISKSYGHLAESKEIVVSMQAANLSIETKLKVL